MEELENFLSNRFLDIEFAINTNMDVYLLQVRKITTQPNWNRAVSQKIDAELNGIQSFLRTRLKPCKDVYGKTTVLGQMPDWNPAEMIGRAPKALAFSLYRNLISNNEWRTAREKMGYKSPASQPLIVSLAGQPFVDTRLSFHSFLPFGLDDEICSKLVDIWTKNLAAKPELHDKVEFDIAITSYSFDLDKRFDALLGEGLSQKERAIYKSFLKRHTFPLIVGDGDASIDKALQKLELINDGGLDFGSQELSSLFPLLEKCKRYGTEPFAILARHGFIAQTLMRSLVEINIITEEELSLFQASIRTIASELVDDMNTLQAGQLTVSKFMEDYGHLGQIHMIFYPRDMMRCQSFSLTKVAKKTRRKLSITNFIYLMISLRQ